VTWRDYDEQRPYDASDRLTPSGFAGKGQKSAPKVARLWFRNVEKSDEPHRARKLYFRTGYEIGKLRRASRTNRGTSAARAQATNIPNRFAVSECEEARLLRLALTLVHSWRADASCPIALPDRTGTGPGRLCGNRNS